MFWMKQFGTTVTHAQGLRHNRVPCSPAAAPAQPSLYRGMLTCMVPVPLSSRAGCSPRMHHCMCSAAASLAVEMEPRFYALRNINEKEGTFEADFELKVRWGQDDSSAAPADAASRVPGPAALHSSSRLRPPDFYISESVATTELERRGPAPLAYRPQWSELSVRTRTTSLARYELQDFPYDVHKLRVVVRLPNARQQGIRSVAAVQESKPTPRLPDLGLQDWLVLRQRCYMRTVRPGSKWFLRCDAPTETNNWDDGLGTLDRREAAAAVAASAASTSGPRRVVGAQGRGRGKAKAPKAMKNMDATRTLRTRPKVEFVMEFLVQRRATFWWTTVYLPLLAMELIVPQAFAMPVQDLSSRLVLIVTLVLTPAVFKTALNDRLPTVGYNTTMDEQFLFAYMFILASSAVHAGLHNLIDLHIDMELVKQLNVVGAVGSMAVLLSYHIRHYTKYFMPYRKRLSMFERRSFYAPPVVATMDTWREAAENLSPVDGMATHSTTGTLDSFDGGMVNSLGFDGGMVYSLGSAALLRDSSDEDSSGEAGAEAGAEMLLEEARS